MVCDIPTINFKDPEPPKNTLEVSFVKYRAQVGTTTEHFYALFVYDKPEKGSGSNWFVEAKSSESLEPHYVKMKPGRADHTKLLTLGSATATSYPDSWENVQAESPQVFGNLRKPAEWFLQWFIELETDGLITLDKKYLDKVQLKKELQTAMNSPWLDV